MTIRIEPKGLDEELLQEVEGSIEDLPQSRHRQRLASSVRDTQISVPVESFDPKALQRVSKVLEVDRKPIAREPSPPIEEPIVEPEEEEGTLQRLLSILREWLVEYGLWMLAVALLLVVVLWLVFF